MKLFSSTSFDFLIFFLLSFFFFQRFTFFFVCGDCGQIIFQFLWHFFTFFRRIFTRKRFPKHTWIICGRNMRNRMRFFREKRRKLQSSETLDSTFLYEVSSDSRVWGDLRANSSFAANSLTAEMPLWCDRNEHAALSKWTFSCHFLTLGTLLKLKKTNVTHTPSRESDFFVQFLAAKLQTSKNTKKERPISCKRCCKPRIDLRHKMFFYKDKLLQASQLRRLEQHKYSCQSISILGERLLLHAKLPPHHHHHYFVVLIVYSKSHSIFFLWLSKISSFAFPCKKNYITLCMTYL